MRTVQTGRGEANKSFSNYFTILPLGQRMCCLPREHVAGVALSWISSPLLSPQSNPRTPFLSPKGRESVRLSPSRKTALPPSGLLAGPHTFSCTMSKSTSFTHSVCLAYDVHTMCISTSLLAVLKEINMPVWLHRTSLSSYPPHATFF